MDGTAPIPTSSSRLPPACYRHHHITFAMFVSCRLYTTGRGGRRSAKQSNRLLPRWPVRATNNQSCMYSVLSCHVYGWCLRELVICLRRSSARATARFTPGAHAAECVSKRRRRHHQRSRQDDASSHTHDRNRGAGMRVWHLHRAQDIDTCRSRGEDVCAIAMRRGERDAKQNAHAVQMSLFHQPQAGKQIAKRVRMVPVAFEGEERR